MKSLISFLFAVTIFIGVTSYSHAKTFPPPTNDTAVIGAVNNGVISFVADSNTVRKDLQKFINNHLSPTVAFKHVKIISNSSNFYLVATGTQAGLAVKTTLHLLQNNQCLFVTGFTVSCTTSDCASESLGCVPALTACTACNNDGKCTKSTSNNVHGIFPSVPAGSCSALK